MYPGQLQFKHTLTAATRIHQTRLHVANLHTNKLIMAIDNTHPRLNILAIPSLTPETSLKNTRFSKVQVYTV